MIVVVSALPEELSPLAHRLREQRRETAPGRVGRLGDVGVRLVATGAGRRRATEGVRALVDGILGGSIVCDALLLVGVAGGLDPKLRLGDVVRVGRVLRVGPPADHGAADGHAVTEGSELSDREPATAVTVDRIVAEASEKERLWVRLGRPRSAVVDMESYHWRSALHGLSSMPPVALLRAVSDTAETSLPRFLTRCVGRDGEISRARVALHGLTSPRGVSSLLRLRRDVRLAATRLADAVEELVVAGSLR